MLQLAKIKKFLYLILFQLKFIIITIIQIMTFYDVTFSLSFT